MHHWFYDIISRAAIADAKHKARQEANRLRQTKGDGMNHKEFFDKHADDVIYTTTFHAGQTTRLETIGRVEYLYQMFKARMMEELCVNLKQAGKVEDDDGHSYFVYGELVDKE